MTATNPTTTNPTPTTTPEGTPAMTNTLNSITTTFERDGETVTRTQWFPIHGYVLTMTDFGTWKKWNVTSPQGLPEVVEEARYELDAAPKFGVNWAAAGTVDTQEARTFASQVAAAAEAADQLTFIAASVN